MTRWQALPPGVRGALVLGGLAAALTALMAFAGTPQARNPVFALTVMAAAAGLGLLLGAAPLGVWAPPRAALALALAAGLAGLGLVLAWGQVSGSFAAREWQWLRDLAAGLLVLPALLPAALVRRPGAATVGLTLQGLATAAAATVDAPLALLFVPLTALPVEAWLTLRHQDGRASTWAVAGALLTGVAVAATRQELWTATGLWPLAGALASAAVGGGLMGVLAQIVSTPLRHRLGLTVPPAADGEALGGWE